MILLYIMLIYIVGGILVSGIAQGVDKQMNFEDSVWAFFLWPIYLIILCTVAVAKVTKAFINEQKPK